MRDVLSSVCGLAGTTIAILAILLTPGCSSSNGSAINATDGGVNVTGGGGGGDRGGLESGPPVAANAFCEQYTLDDVADARATEPGHVVGVDAPALSSCPSQPLARGRDARRLVEVAVATLLQRIAGCAEGFVCRRDACHALAGAGAPCASVADCASGLTCGATSVCEAKHAVADHCSVATDCISNACTDSVCTPTAAVASAFCSR